MQRANATPPTSTWMLRVRPTIRAHPRVAGQVHEWGLTLIEPHHGRACRIDGIWFEVSHRTTVNARETVERMNKTQALTRAELCALIEEHRVPGGTVTLDYTVDTVKRTERFTIANAYGFLKTLDWGGVTA